MYLLTKRLFQYLENENLLRDYHELNRNFWAFFSHPVTRRDVAIKKTQLSTKAVLWAQTKQVLITVILTLIKSGSKSRILIHEVNVKVVDCLVNIWLTLYQKTIQITSRGKTKVAMTAYSFKPNKPIMNIRKTIIAAIILRTKLKK